MPRLTDEHFLSFGRWLSELWVRNRQAFGFISYQDQRFLHEYFRPSVELSHLELLAHRRRITAERPALPQCAGRALRKLKQEMEAAAAKPAKIATKGKGRNKPIVHVVAQPKLDLNLLLKAIMTIGESENKAD